MSQMERHTTAYLTTAYLAPVSYYKAMAHYPTLYLEQECNYVKQTYRNRCHIVGANGVQALSVPIEKPHSGKCFTRDIKVSNHGNWQHLHWQAIRSAYGNTPYFEYYEQEFAPFYERHTPYLVDLNEGLQQVVRALLQLDTPPILHTTSYKEEFAPHEVDLREAIHPKRPTPIELTTAPYYQVFEQKRGFTPDMSIIDLLFNMGTEAILVLKGLI